MAKKSPRWGKPAETLVGEMVEEFRTNLRRITVRTASHDKADSIDQKHVERALEHLIRCGLDQTPWYKRPQLKVTGAAVMMGSMLAVPDFSPVFFSDDRQKAVVLGTMIVLGLLALSLYAWAWAQNRL